MHLRRVVGNSMAPTLVADQIIVISGRSRRLREGDVVVVVRSDREMVKRIHIVDAAKGVFVLGDNANESTDSRSFGWLDHSEITGRVIWPRTKNK
ncbi:MAG TPA: S26 family signal peptidase [Candidatus Saccharimonadales bacterium]|nr:S26 family signal peptidase [Candidatus Saccharimonadales bacterium]